jgi:hypothetical protein
MAATTATFSGLRTALAAQLATIRGLRTAATVPDNPAPPVAVIVPVNVEYDTSFGRGTDTYTFSVLLIVGRMSERAAQTTLDAYINPTGATSIKAAINADPTLGGACQSARVTNMVNYGSLIVGDTEYLSADFQITIYA